MPTTPAASAARNGFPSDPDAVNASGQINQFLGTHGITAVYGGNLIVRSSATSDSPAGSFDWVGPASDPTLPSNIGLPDYDIDQPFAMPAGQTAIGRITAALQPVGIGADVQTTLYPDNGSGAPNTSAPLASTVIPAPWITNLAAPDGLSASGPLATPSHNSLLAGQPAISPWSQPAIGPNGAGLAATPTTGGSYFILLGGSDTVTSAPSANVATIQYLGSQAISAPQPQPPLPQPSWYGMAATTASTLMYAGGTNGASFYSNVWTSSWDSDTGTVGAWSAQAALPTPLIQGGAASWGDTMYVVGGSTTLSSANAVPNVWYASATNGQITTWAAGPPLPQPLQALFVEVVGNWLIVAGGQTTADVTSGAVYYAPINADGSLSGWRMGPPLPTPVYSIGSQWNRAATDSAMIVTGAHINGSTGSTAAQVLSVSDDGISGWQQQLHIFADDYQAGAFPNGNPGEWDLVALATGAHGVTTMIPTPLISIPLPASGLTAGSTYHLLFHQIGGDINNYVQVGELANTTPSWQYTTRGSSGPWAPSSGGSMMVNVYDQTPTGQPIHAWVDPNAENLAVEASTYIHDADGRLLGECTATGFVTQPGEDPAFLPSVAQLVYAGDGGMPIEITQLA